MGRPNPHDGIGETWRQIQYRKPRNVVVQRYNDMLCRTKGKVAGDGRSAIWLGMEILPRQTFIDWSLSPKSGFMELFEAWKEAGFPRRLSPSIHRKNRSEGYTLENIEWITHYDNSLPALELGKKTRKKKGMNG